MAKKYAIGYARVMTTKQAEAGLSLSAQEKEIRDWCSKNGYHLKGFYTDAGLSGDGFDNRPSIKAALSACCESTVLVSCSLGRLTRSVKDLVAIADSLSQIKANLVIIREGIDTTLDRHGMIFRMLEGMATFERDSVSERASLIMQKKKLKGEYTGGSVPYGFALSKDGRLLHEDSDEQRVIELAKKLRKQGHTLQGIAEDLYGLGAMTRNNTKFSPYQISRILGEVRQ